MDSSVLAMPRFRDRSRHAAPQVFEFLKDQIVGLELKPGAVLSRAELQARFGLSSTPIRDALIRLQEEDLVEIFPQHATRVSRIDVGRAHQAQFLRRSIELEVVRTLALRPDPELIERLRAIVAEQKRLARAGSLGELTAADQEFHRTMYEAAAVPDLWDLVRRHSGHIDRLRRLHLPVPGKARQIVDEHLLVIEAIAEGRPDAAQDRLRDHLSKSLALSEEMRSRTPEFFRD